MELTRVARSSFLTLDGWNRMIERHLILLTGPVGGGKSTVALALADRLRASGLEAAVIDLDLLYCMARQCDGFGDLNVWRTARRGAAALADAFYASGLQAVVVEGGFFSESECEDLRRHVVSHVKETFVTLQVSAFEALRRAQTDSDPDRVVSRNPRVQQVLYAEFMSALPFLKASSVVLLADHLTPEELAEAIGQVVFADVEAV